MDEYEKACAERDRILDQWLGTFKGEERDRMTLAAAHFLALGDYEHEMPRALKEAQRRVEELDVKEETDPG